MGLSLFLVIWHFTRKPFFPWSLTLPPIKTEFLHLSHPYSVTTLPLHRLTHVSIFIVSNHPLLMFSWSPLGLLHMAASSSQPCSEHSRWITLVLVVSIPSPLESNYNISYVVVSHTSHFIHYWPPNILLRLYWTPVWVINHPLRNQVSHSQVNHPYMLWQGKLLVHHLSCFLLSSSPVLVHQSLYYDSMCLC